MSDATPRRTFVQGLRCRSPIVLVVALALAALALAAVQRTVTSGAFARVRESLLLRQTRDDFFHDTYTVGRLKLHRPDELPVYLLGGSAARESLVSEASFAAVVRRKTGVRVEPYILCSQNQTFGQSLAIVDNLPPGPGIVVIAVNNNRFRFDPRDVAQQVDGYPMLLASPTLDRFVKANPPSGLPAIRLPGILPGIMRYVADVWQVKLSRLADHRPVAVSYHPHWVTARRAWSLGRKRRGVQQWIKSYGPGFAKHVSYNARLLDTLVRRAGQRGFRVVLLEETENTAVVGHSFDRFKRVYRPLVRTIAARYGVPYLDLQAKLRLPDADFWDYIHAVEPARVIWQQVLAEALAPTLRDAAAGTTGSVGASGRRRVA